MLGDVQVTPIAPDQWAAATGGEWYVLVPVKQVSSAAGGELDCDASAEGAFSAALNKKALKMHTMSKLARAPTFMAALSK